MDRMAVWVAAPKRWPPPLASRGVVVEAVVQVVLAAVRLEVAVKSCRLPPLMLMLLGRSAEDFRCASRKEEEEEEEEDEAVRRGRVQLVVARVRSGRAALLSVGPLLATLAK